MCNISRMLGAKDVGVLAEEFNFLCHVSKGGFPG